MVCTVKVHHAKMIVEAVNNHEALKARLAEVEKDRDRARDCHEETAQKLHSYIHLCAAASRPATQQTTSKLGAWLAAALDDPNVCAEMKADIETWMNAGEPAYGHATQVVDREAVALSELVFKAIKFVDAAAGEGIVFDDLDPALILLDYVNAIDTDCWEGIAEAVCDQIISLLRPAEPAEAEGVGEPVAWRVLITKNAKTYNEYTERLPFEPLEGSGVVVRREPEPLYTHPPKSPDTSAAVLQSHALKQALDCLSEIAAAHIPDCPAHYAGDELSWVQRHVGSLRLKAEIARDGIAAAIRQLSTSKLVNPEKMYSYNSEAKVEFEK